MTPTHASKFKKRLFMHLKHEGYEPTTPERLADDLRIADEDRADFIETVSAMAEEGELTLGQGGLVTLPPLGKEVVGRFKKHPKGFGFIIPNDPTTHGDLFVPPDMTLEAFTGDEVRAEVVNTGKARGGHSPFVGNIVEIISRKQSSFTGEVYHDRGMWWARTDGKVLTEPVVLKDAESKNVNEGDKVVFEILHYPEGDFFAEGVVVKVLGAAGEPDVETQAVIAAYDLPGDFEEKVREEARSLTEAFDKELEPHVDGGRPFERAERYDLRDAFITTIDPPDAKDYDDAISIERLDSVAGGGRGWRLGIHIADVAHFVTPGSELDKEAQKRGNSCYLPRLVIPMLPEILSNGICSLQEGVPRFAKSVFIDYDEDGNVKGKGFAATIIQSKKRMTYLEAQALIDGDEEEARKHAKTDTPYSDELRRAVRDMNTLSRRIRERRKRNGMIHLDLPEVELVYDKTGNVIDAVPEDDAYTHTLIEMFMVEANEAVARLFEELEIPHVRRVHPEPVPGSTDNLRDFVKVAGYRIPKNPTREDLQGLLEGTAGTPAARAVHMAVLRTLTRAEYSTALMGHFALASEAYSHFTSPIRRYADLTAHRALTEYLAHTQNGTRPPREDHEKTKLGKALKETVACPDEQTLMEFCSRCNRTEDNAESAERELRQLLVLQFLEREHMGDTLPGVITGVTANGVFIQLTKYLAEGMCKVADLPVPADSKKKGNVAHGRVLWQIDRRTGALVERNSGRSYNIGDRVDAVISQIDLARRQMDLVIANADAREVGKRKLVKDGKATVGGKQGTKDDESGEGNRDYAGVNGPAAGLTIGEVEEWKPKKSGSQKRSQRSRSRDKRKSDYRSDRKDKGKRQ
jgi:ribonuclease R